ILIGIVLLMISILMRIAGTEEHEDAEAGGVLIIGPIPIILGTNLKIAKSLILMAIILFITTFVLFILAQGLIR
ncbi:MAG: DUF131 domain-containing protein, partial [Desulfurococcaceae archaeon]